MGGQEDYDIEDETFMKWFIDYWINWCIDGWTEWKRVVVRCDGVGVVKCGLIVGEPLASRLWNKDKG